MLLLEGTFPFVAGGVSSWVHQMILGFPELKFGAIFLGSRAQDYGDMHYTLPANLVHFETAYIFEAYSDPPVSAVDAAKGTMPMVEEVHHLFETDMKHPNCVRMFSELMDEAGPDGKLSREVFLYSKQAWDFIKRSYRRRSTDPSFVDYFWTVRTIHTPFWILRDVAVRAPPARLYHAISTGYAGILGVLLKHRQNRPLLLSEHGIYVKERKIDLIRAHWLKDNRNIFDRDPSELSYFTQLWIRFFEHLGYVTYQASNDIVALYEANRQRQIADGAPEHLTSNIPNGIDITRFASLRKLRPVQTPAVMCLIGRVVPIKDIKTFIRAMRIVANALPDAQAWIAGPEDESPDYAGECRALVSQLELDASVKFMGFQKLTDLLPKVGLVVLSSISEGLPLVVLEGFAAGVPALTTDVGACRQLIEGLPGPDAALGAAGRVVRIADPQGMAEAALELLSQPEPWQRASQAAIQRVETYYAAEQMFERYRRLYEKNMAWQA
jgi:polysaccharide biosynthesis protein PelF